jgi:single-strand DNA-binding protein
MSLAILAQGSLVADPQERTSAKGGSYVTAQLRVATDDAPILVSIIAFADTAVTALLALRKGDAAAVTSRAKLTTWSGKDGEAHHGLSLVADAVLTVYQAGKRRTAATTGAEA